MFGRWVRVAVAWLLPWLPDKGSKAPRANSIAHTADKVSSATRRTTWDGAVDAAAVAAVAVLTAVFTMSASSLVMCTAVGMVNCRRTHLRRSSRSQARRALANAGLLSTTTICV